MTKEGSVFQKPWKSMKTTTFPLYFSTRRAWDPSRKLDLAICYTGKKITALYDLISPTWWPKKVPNLLQENTKKTRVYQTSIPYLPCLVRTTTGQMGNTICLCFQLKSRQSLFSHLYPICPLVPFQYIVWEQGQMAGRQLGQIETSIARGWEQPR